ncbi:putative ABC-class ATPase [Natronospira proteinivora]|uniref:ABC-class ATPase n=1 Tax=Natronospira proteinivora TaxID=1807133 RepID=A0ABT1GAK8_9GAMM|nr:ABC-ATPase domain-containing protein [Natronospira proteinivora]MCP1728359.1 putative ABC-class ATPase [Natronospira proteinivora]
MNALNEQCRNIDGRSYKAYKRLMGRHDLGVGRELLVDHVQADPFAPPSRMRFRISWAQCRLPDAALDGPDRRRAARDWLARCFRAETRTENVLSIDAGGQTVLERSCVLFDESGVELRLKVALPARGRKIMGRQAAEALTERLPAVAQAILCPEGADIDAMIRHCQVVEDQAAMRRSLVERGLVAFVADGSVLPRASGVSEGPLPEAVPFESPDSLRVTLDRPNAGPIAGMGLPSGVTLIVGGGYHGKSTLLSALQESIHDHVAGDGREAVVTRADTMKIRAEDGRSVAGVDLSPFIGELPGGSDTRCFHSQDASGSTSQAAALLEALEAGSRCLLMDEDTSATNFLIRDERMRQLVSADEEPITPFVDRIRSLAEEGVSTLLVLGGSGDYLPVADTVVQMKAFQPLDVTRRAREIGGEPPEPVAGPDLLPVARTLKMPALREAILGRKGRMRIRVRETGLTVGAAEINLAAVEQLQDPSLQRGVAWLLMALIGEEGPARLEGLPGKLAEWLDREDWHGLAGSTPVDAARPRVVDVLATLSRLRAVQPCF